MKWETALRGTDFDLTVLSNLFTSEKLSVTQEQGEECFIRTIQFDDLTTAEEVHQCAENIVSTLRGVATLHGLELEDITIGAVYEVRDDQTRINRGTFLQGASRSHTRGAAYITVIDESGYRVENVPFGDRIIRAIDSEPSLQEVVDLLPWSMGQPRRLYFMYEMIRQLAGDPVAHGWVHVAEKKRFKDSMQDRRVYGSLARHGSITGEPPRRPMLIEEANRFILALVNKWVEKALRESTTDGSEGT